MMKIAVLKVLILGGTHFLGIHLTEELLDRGHEVTLFNRGTQNTDLFPTIEKLKGDRDGNLEALLGRRWDAVIDTSGQIPRIVKQSAEVLSNETSHYTFISTIGVYDHFQPLNITEDSALAKLQDNETEFITENTYGALKHLCESVIQQYFPNRALIIRPGLIVGVHDRTDRFTYWVRRIAQGGWVLAPARQPAQFIDVRDLSKWIVRMIERQATGVYNATGPSYELEYVLKECKQASKSNAQMVWVDEDFLIEQDVKDWSELPLWLSKQRLMPGFFNIHIHKAVQAGLTFRPVRETIQSILEWDTSRGKVQLEAGLDPQREQELLAQWEKRS